MVAVSQMGRRRRRDPLAHSAGYSAQQGTWRWQAETGRQQCRGATAAGRLLALGWWGSCGGRSPLTLWAKMG